MIDLIVEEWRYDSRTSSLTSSKLALQAHLVVDLKIKSNQIKSNLIN